MAPKRIVQDIVPSNKESKSRTRSNPIRRHINVVDEDIDEKVEIKTGRRRSSQVTTPAPEKNKWDEEMPIIVKRRSSVEPEDSENVYRLDQEYSDVKESKPIPQYSARTSYKPKGNYSKFITFGVIFVCIATIAVALSLLYTKAIVTITPTTVPINVDGNFLAKKDNNTSSDILNYQVVTINYDEYKTVPATDGPLVQTKSKGTVTIYNNYSSTTQKILAGTKISNLNNKVYKTTWSVVVPGKKFDKGKLIPGAVDVGVVADQAGIEYDMLLADNKSDFSVVAYKGTPKFTTITAKLKKDITGGFAGKKKIISPDTEKAGYADIESTLKDKLLKNIKLAVPDDLILFDNAYTIEYQKLPTTNSDSGTAKLGSKGTLYGVIFNSKAFVDNLAKKQIDDNRLQNYRVDGIKDLKFTIINSKDNPVKKGLPISFSLSGPIKITGVFNENELKNKLISIKLDQMNAIIKQYTAIKSVSVVLTPFWMRRFPNTIDNIVFEYK